MIPLTTIPPAPDHLWLAVTHVPRLGGATLRGLLARFGSLQAILAASATQLSAAWPRLPPETVRGLAALNPETVRPEHAALTEQGLQLLHWQHADYPPALFDLSGPPPVLFVQAATPWQAAPPKQVVAMVGSRRVSQQAKADCFALAKKLTTAGFTVVSGLAVGIDTAAHAGALAAGKGQTWAVLGNGLPQIYPRQNAGLARQIRHRGALLSEQRPGTSAEPSHLVSRNRLVAALSGAVIVMTAHAHSGALETARRAQQLGRLLFAAEDGAGGRWLLRHGAQPLPAFEELVTRLQTPSQANGGWNQLALF